MNRKCKDVRGLIKICEGNVVVCYIFFMKVLINILIYVLIFFVLIVCMINYNINLYLIFN